jgi:hypothetical protein
MPQVGFEPMISVSEWAKTGYALDHAAIVAGCYTQIGNFW